MEDSGFTAAEATVFRKMESLLEVEGCVQNQSFRLAWGSTIIFPWSYFYFPRRFLEKGPGFFT